MARKPDHSPTILLIAIFKLLKALLILGASIAAFRLVNADLGETLREWAKMFHVAPGNKHLQELIEHSLNITPKKLEVAGAVLLAYAAMFGTEGVGLLMGKRWAEYMVVITTAGLMPLEGYEIYEKPNVFKVVALVINAAAVVYLIARLWKTREVQQGDVVMSQ